jgi:hypothetical protein
VVVVPERPLAHAEFSPERDALVVDAHIRAPAAQRVTTETIRAIATHGGVGG